MRHKYTSYIHLVVLLILLLVSNSLIAQDSLEHRTIGSGYYVYSISCENGHNSYDYLSTGDLCIESFNNKDYVRYAIFVYNGGGDKDIYYNFYFRQENERIYRYDENTGSEYLIFDFSLNEGDIFTDRYGNDFSVQQVIDTVVVQQWDGQNKGKFRKLKLCSCSDPSVCDEWLEGLGSLNTGILSPLDVKGLLTNDQSLATTCKSIRINTLLEALTPSFRIHKTIDTDYLKSKFLKPNLKVVDNSSFIKDNHELGYEFVGDMLHVVGKPQILGNNYIYLMCNVQGNHIRLNYILEPYCSGVWGVQDYGIDTCFSGFLPGTYMVSYIGNMISYTWDEEVEVTCYGNQPEGDVNSDGSTNISDIVTIINVMAGTESNTGTDMNAPTAAKAKSDVNHDGKTDISDITAVINIMAGQK